MTGQHAGRLRRVYQRFGATFEQFEGLYWSHYQAAVDWNDAEMWLEGAVQSRWSVSQMRHQRWDSLGQVEEQPVDEDIVLTELDEDIESSSRERPEVEYPATRGRCRKAPTSATKKEVPLAALTTRRLLRMRMMRRSISLLESHSSPFPRLRCCRRMFRKRLRASSWRLSATRASIGTRSAAKPYSAVSIR